MNYTHWSSGPGNTKERVIWAQAHKKNFRSNLYLTIRISRWMFDRSWIFNKSRGMQLPFLLFVVYQLKKKKLTVYEHSIIHKTLSHALASIYVQDTQTYFLPVGTHQCCMGLRSASCWALRRSTHITGTSDILCVSVARGEAMGLGHQHSQEDTGMPLHSL